MSRAQQGQVTQQAQNENTSYNTDATTAFNNTQNDIGDYASSVGAFKAANPYVQGGSVQTADNQQAADTAAGLAQSAGQSLQSAAVRSGQNAGGAIAATEQMNENNDRALVGQEASNTKDLAAANTGYGEAVTGDTANIANMQDTVANQQATAAQGALGTQEQAAQTPSFMDELGQGLITAGTNFAGGFGGGYGSAVGKAAGCWIAAELYGGWDNWRTIRVRTWLLGEFSLSWYGALVMKAYARWGERIARAIQHRSMLRSGFRRVFDAALREAVKRG